MNRFLASLFRCSFVGRLLAAWRAYIDRACTSGHDTKPSVLLWHLCRIMFSVWAFLQAGRIKVVGKKNLKTRGRVIFCPNHSSFLDAVVMLPTMPRRVRGIGADDVFHKFGGLVGLVLAKLGVIPVDRSHGKTVLKPATDVVVSGESMVIFPEGKVSASGALLPFKLGPAYIATAAFEELGGSEPVSIVPVHICYGRRHQASALNYWKMGFKWRGDVTITAFDPIKIHELENRDPEHIMQLVRKAISSVCCPSNEC